MKRRKRIIRQLKGKDIPVLRQKILEEQKGICPVCNKPIDRPCLDHQHKKRIGGSGLIRGVLCSSCNIFIAKSENNCIRYGIGLKNLPDVLRRAADYFEKKQYPYLHPSEAPKPKKLKKASYRKLVKAVGGKVKVPEYPKSGKLTKKLKELYVRFNIEPEFYKS